MKLGGHPAYRFQRDALSDELVLQVDDLQRLCGCTRTRHLLSGHHDEAVLRPSHMPFLTYTIFN